MPPNWAGDAAQAPATHETPAPRSEAPTSAQGDAPQVHAAAPAPTSSAPRQVSGDAAPSSAPPVPVAAASTPVAASHAPTTLTAASALQEHAPSTQPAYRDDAPPPHSAPVNAPAAHLAPPAAHGTPPAPTDTPDWATPSAPGTSRLPVLSAELAACATLEHVQDVLGPCTRCKLHRLGRQKIVFGVGNPHADVMFVGEGPGADEDRIGEPFVGKAGQLLTRIIENGMGLPRSAVYIANVVKCRPPQNRDPEPDEMEACEPFLLAQIRLVQPRVLVTLGRPATQTLLRNTIPITKQRGKWTHFNGIPLMPTFHPAYVLRNPAEKRPVWEDIQEVMRFLRLPIPSRRGQ
ncbi:MAG: uracil-DNA glycosylase [Deltaproteobacteria bacterium]|nr:uracil-DNA glycosylase [Deltaproteobacteria bacterium]